MKLFILALVFISNTAFAQLTPTIGSGSKPGTTVLIEIGSADMPSYAKIIRDDATGCYSFYLFDVISHRVKCMVIDNKKTAVDFIRAVAQMKDDHVSPLSFTFDRGSAIELRYESPSIAVTYAPSIGRGMISTITPEILSTLKTVNL